VFDTVRDLSWAGERSALPLLPLVAGGGLGLERLLAGGTEPRDGPEEREEERVEGSGAG
jgi:hypothetical protein